MLSEVRMFLGLHDDEVRTDRRLGTVLFTDIVGSTELVVALGDAAWRERLADHDRLTRATIARHGGRYVDSAGDGVLARFDGPAAAVRCGLEIVDAAASIELKIRAGVHTGELELDGGKVRGIAVHIGARVAALAGPGEVLVSSTVKELTAGSGLVFEDAGEHELKGVPDRRRMYRVVG